MDENALCVCVSYALQKQAISGKFRYEQSKRKQ